MKREIIYIDVDDTLVRFAGRKRIPIPQAIERVRAFHKDGALLYLWSTGGAEYAKETAAELGLTELFAGFLPKPTIIIDDQNIMDWRGLIHQRPY